MMHIIVTLLYSNISSFQMVICTWLEIIIDFCKTEHHNEV